MKKPLRSVLDYLILTLIISLAVILTLFFNGNRFYQQAIIIGLSLLYILWGTLHHLKEKNLHPKIILEYVLFATIGSVLVLGLLK
jgi:uncharacterized membrane protein YfcA